ncbi:MAG: hypothetical protein DHS80DRAFT_31967 [Piptocephalis tieghemiana]|nr:MAG: hypothetical protein DHS80DRAFT_31967 [Piptocephalis tieghemiana]
MDTLPGLVISRGGILQGPRILLLLISPGFVQAIVEHVDTGEGSGCSLSCYIPIAVGSVIIILLGTFFYFHGCSCKRRSGDDGSSYGSSLRRAGQSTSRTAVNESHSRATIGLTSCQDKYGCHSSQTSSMA